MFTTNPETQIEIEKLAAMLRELPPGETASYAALSEAVSYNVQHKPFALMRARRVVEQESGLRFGTVMREGVKRLPATALPGIGMASRKRMSRMAKRQAARLTGLRYNDIDATIQARIDAERSLLGAISVVAATNSEKLSEHTTTGPMVAAQVLDKVRAA
jgi:hypothetical protein